MIDRPALAVAIVAGTILPYLAARDHRLLKPESEKAEDVSDDDEDEEDRELVRIQEMVREWKAEAAREGRPLRLPTSKLLFRSLRTRLTRDDGFKCLSCSEIFGLVHSYCLVA